MSDASRILDQIADATEGLPWEERNTFNNVLIGALATSNIDPAVWESALAVAASHVQARKEPA